MENVTVQMFSATPAAMNSQVIATDGEGRNREILDCFRIRDGALVGIPRKDNLDFPFHNSGTQTISVDMDFHHLQCHGIIYKTFAKQQGILP